MAEAVASSLAEAKRQRVEVEEVNATTKQLLKSEQNKVARLDEELQDLQLQLKNRPYQPTEPPSASNPPSVSGLVSGSERTRQFAGISDLDSVASCLECKQLKREL